MNRILFVAILALIGCATGTPLQVPSVITAPTVVPTTHIKTEVSPSPEPSASIVPSPTAVVPLCNPIEWTPTDGSNQGMTLQVMTDGLNPGGFNSSWCQVGNRVWFQFLVVFPITDNTHQVKINLPVLGSGVDVGASIGGCLQASGKFCSIGGWADVTPGSFVKFFEVGTQIGAATWADLSGAEIAVSGSYLTNVP